MSGRKYAVYQGGACSSLMYVLGAQALYSKVAQDSRVWFLDDLLFDVLIDVEERIESSTKYSNSEPAAIKFNHNKTEFMHSRSEQGKVINLLGHAFNNTNIIGPFKPRLLRSLQKALINLASLWTTELDATKFKIR